MLLGLAFEREIKNYIIAIDDQLPLIKIQCIRVQHHLLIEKSKDNEWKIAQITKLPAKAVQIKFSNDYLKRLNLFH